MSGVLNFYVNNLNQMNKQQMLEIVTGTLRKKMSSHYEKANQCKTALEALEGLELDEVRKYMPREKSIVKRAVTKLNDKPVMKPQNDERKPQLGKTQVRVIIKRYLTANGSMSRRSIFGKLMVEYTPTTVSKHKEKISAALYNMVYNKLATVKKGRTRWDDTFSLK